MEPSPKNRKRKSRITIIVVITLALIVVVIFAFASINRGTSWGYELEKKRFTKVLNRASDEELFIVLKYAIAHHYVPNNVVDPFYGRNVMVGCWQRSLKVYNKLSDREDLLQQIYLDLEVLDDYVNWGQQTGEPYPDTLVSQTILNNVRKDIEQLDSWMGSPSDKKSLEHKYFGTPFMCY